MTPGYVSEVTKSQRELEVDSSTLALVKPLPALSASGDLAQGPRNSVFVPFYDATSEALKGSCSLLMCVYILLK